jgi:radical SAM superfamily enzyme YgiQ (UPF0313 family)
LSRKLLEKNRQRYLAETGENQPAGGKLRIALVYPNTYNQAMANLGFQTVYQLLNAHPDCRCERFFLPDKADLGELQKSGLPLVSLETATPLKEFHLLALSISFENDYLHLPLLFELGEVPLFAAQRQKSDPLVLFGGVCAFLNPEPLGEIADMVAVGEAEPLLPTLIPALVRLLVTQDSTLGDLAGLPGIYLPGARRIDYQTDGRIAFLGGLPVPRSYLANLDQSASRSLVLNREAEFGDMALVEVMRGCSRGCRFCAAGYIYLPARERSLDSLLPQVAAGLCQRSRIGLVGAAVADHTRIAQLQQEIMGRGGEVSVSSLRLDALTEKEVAQLQAAGLKTVAIAPEAGSQRMRDLINKNLSEEQILHAVRLLAEANLLNLKLYFLIGLPQETDADILAILSLADRVRLIWREAGRMRGQLGNLTLSVNPFIPKPFTPLQWAGMEGEKSLKKKIRTLQAGVSRLPNTSLISESLRSAQVQALLARGDRRIGRLLPELAAWGNLGQVLKRNGLSLDFYLTRERDEDEIFPWEVIAQGSRRSYLWQEYQKGLSGQLTPRCFDGCRRCGIC